jgi:hypothetical protein
MQQFTQFHDWSFYFWKQPRINSGINYGIFLLLKAAEIFNHLRFYKTSNGEKYKSYTTFYQIMNH